MTNKEKAREIGENKNNIARFSFENTETTLYYGALEMAEWKDNQFKAYLEKKKASFENYAQAMMFSPFINEIINELFREEETDNTDNDE